MRILHWHQDGLLQETLRLCQADNVGEAHVGVGINDLVLNAYGKIAQVRIIAEVRQGLQHPILKKLLNLLIRILRPRLLLNDSALDRKIVLNRAASCRLARNCYLSLMLWRLLLSSALPLNSS